MTSAARAHEGDPVLPGGLIPARKSRFGRRDSVVDIGLGRLRIAPDHDLGIDRRTLLVEALRPIVPRR